MKIAFFLAGLIGLLQGGMLDTQILPQNTTASLQHITLLDQKYFFINRSMD